MNPRALEEANPFAQSAHYEHLLICTDQRSVPMLEVAFEEEALSVSAFEQKDSNQWKLDILLSEPLEKSEIETRLKLAESAGAVVESWRTEPLEMRDWVSDIQSQFPPLQEGRFFIHGSHIAPKAAPAISLEINAGCAFGTGEHETTACCLQAMEQLDKAGFRPVTLFDLGCGTGILAIAAAKLWPTAQITASDMDWVSVIVAQENAETNHARQIRFHAATGFQHAQLARLPQQELIVANILAKPLVKLAGDVGKRLAVGGYLVLSGLLNRQEKDVLRAYKARGLKHEGTIRRNGWSALVLRK